MKYYYTIKHIVDCITEIIIRYIARIDFDLLTDWLVSEKYV